MERSQDEKGNFYPGMGFFCQRKTVWLIHNDVILNIDI
jgi:hypothetical protein